MPEGPPEAGAATGQATACPLCHAPARPFCTASGRAYFACDHCGLRFLHPSQRPTPAEEQALYQLHENAVDDPGYRRLLSRLADPLLERLAPASQGLDFGCGPGPALAAMLGEAGHRMVLYDPLFAPDQAALEQCYDFVTCTEVAEHFHHPAREFALLRHLVRPGGWLAIMTSFQTEDARFASWHYRRDPTHVAFYREETFHFLAQAWGWHCTIAAKDIVLLQRPAHDEEAACLSQADHRS